MDNNSNFQNQSNTVPTSESIQDDSLHNTCTPCESLYNDSQSSVASDIIKRIDKKTGENVNYRLFDNSVYNFPIDDNIFKIFDQNTYIKTSFAVNNTIFLDEMDDVYDNFNEKDDAAKFEKAIDYLKTFKGGTIRFSKPLSFNRKVEVSDLVGITIEGVQSPYSLQGANFNCGYIEFTNSDKIGLVINGFRDLTLKNINFVYKKDTGSTDYLLEIFKGYDFEIKNLKFRNTVLGGNCLKLGRDTGVLCAFQGDISRVTTVQNGGTGIYTGQTNTSLNFRSCYVGGGKWHIKGTVYSAFISCACDGSNDNGYVIEGGDQSRAHTLTFISCGAEAANRSGFWVGSYVYNITFIAPHSGLNNQGLHPGIGELLMLENNGIGEQEAIKVSNPVSVNKSGNADIYGTSSRCAFLILDSVYKASLGKGIDGANDWRYNKVLQITDESSFPKIASNTINQYGRISSYTRKSANITGNLSGTETWFYLQSEGTYIGKDTKLLGLTIQVNKTITSSTGSSGILTFGDGMNTSSDIISNIGLVAGNKIFHTFKNNEFVDFDHLGIRFHMNDNSIVNDGNITIELFYEKLY
ncbi:hypothetical protein J2810_001117 [Chryseobacterium rhizosphaerae]|uniref:hypothetical protein n=1 Tax=Chryseobacterium rhizosphaerae TaxID=395937 RepID=UPI002858053E|nr:hypothetical protein [Chryseobacterium rhizosphaerae]MDR6545075.1 hypothetical protein [Chryseobacterium rhizosphaerae]